MSRFVQFVVCQHTGDSKKYLFYAPAFSDIKKGDEVLVDTQFGEKKQPCLQLAFHLVMMWKEHCVFLQVQKASLSKELSANIYLLKLTTVGI